MRAGEPVRAGLGAVAFLTRVPVARLLLLDGGDVARGAAVFPLVGAGIGAAVGGTAWGLLHVLPPLVSGAIALAVGVVLTGALHLDALADTADALGAHSRERALSIMREHTIGAYGAVALGVDLLVKAAALAALAERDRVVVSAIAAGALSRSVAVVLGSALESVRDDGAGAVFRVSRLGALVAAALGVGIAVVTGIADGAVLAAVAAAAAVALAVFYRRWLGGATGDLLGAAAELTETAVLVAAVAIS